MVELVKLLNDQLKQQNNQLNSFKLELEKRDKELEKKNNQIDELIKKVGIVNSNITTNIQNNIKLLAYKNTDISELSDKDIIKCMKHANMCIPYLVREIHFNPKTRNHNIYISNLKNHFILVYDGIKWNLHNRNDILDEIITDKECIIDDWLQKEEQDEEIMKKFNRY